jgi:hypothetical protein
MSESRLHPLIMQSVVSSLTSLQQVNPYVISRVYSLKKLGRDLSFSRCSWTLWRKEGGWCDLQLSVTDCATLLNYICSTLSLLLRIWKRLQRTIDWSRSKNPELSSLWVPCVCQNPLSFYKEGPGFCGRWSFLAPGYFCLFFMSNRVYINTLCEGFTLSDCTKWFLGCLSKTVIYWSNITLLQFLWGSYCTGRACWGEYLDTTAKKEENRMETIV